MTPLELIELLLTTDLDPVQLAHLAGLPLPVVRGCHDVLHGTLDGSRGLTVEDAPLYVRGQRIADAWFMEEPTADEI
jgi:hypothetical protein